MCTAVYPGCAGWCIPRLDTSHHTQGGVYPGGYLPVPQGGVHARYVPQGRVYLAHGPQGGVYLAHGPQGGVCPAHVPQGGVCPAHVPQGVV